MEGIIFFIATISAIICPLIMLYISMHDDSGFGKTVGWRKTYFVAVVLPVLTNGVALYLLLM